MTEAPSPSLASSLYSALCSQKQLVPRSLALGSWTSELYNSRSCLRKSLNRGGGWGNEVVRAF